MATILVIDDEDSIRHLLKDVLEKATHRVLEARDGREGLNLYQKNKVDLVLMDILMPGTDGLEATLQLTREYLDAKIIAMTAHREIGISSMSPSCSARDGSSKNRLT